MGLGGIGLRPAQLADHTAVDALMQKAAFKQRSARGWEWLFVENPALGANLEMPIGWVLEYENAVVGYLANIPFSYWRGNQNYKGATCSSLYVDQKFRSQSVKLMSAFFRQNGIDFFLTTTANQASRPLYELFKAATPPDPAFLKDFAWVADAGALLLYGAEKYAGRTRVAAITAAAAAPFARLALRLSGKDLRRSGGRHGVEVNELSLAEIDESFDVFWQALRSTGQLMADRSARTLRWRMCDPDMGSRPHLLAARGPDGLEGYALAARHQPRAGEISRFNVFDIAIHPKAGCEVLPALLARTAELAVSERASLVVLTGYSGHIANFLPVLKPFERKRTMGSAYVKAINPQIGGAGCEIDFWRATPLDGDRGLAIRDGTHG